MRPFVPLPVLWAGLWLLLAMSGLAQSLPDPATTISLILSHHPTVRKAQLNVDAAQANLDGSRLQPNPTLTLSATAGDASENANALTQTFELSGQPRLRYEQAQARLESARMQLRSARRQVAAAVCGSWLSLWENRQLATMAQLRLQLMTDMVRVGRRRYEVGEIPQNESLRVELAAAEAEADYQRAQASSLGAERSFKVLLELVSTEAGEPEATTAFEGLFQVPKLSDSEVPWSLEQVLASAQTNLDVSAIRQEEKALTLDAELIGKERAPQFGVSLYRSQFFGTGIQQGAVAYISWPVFDWGSNSYRKKAQQAQAQAQLAEADEKVLELRQQVADVWSRWQAAQRIRDILTDQAKRYEELAREARVGYDLGMLTLTDVQQTESAFRQAGVQLIQAQAEVFRLELGLLERTNLPWPAGLLEE